MKDDGSPGTLAQLLAEMRSNRAVLVAAEDPRWSLTADDLRSQVATLGSQLAACGLGRDAVIAVALPNGVAMATAFLGVTAHAICAPLNPAFSEAEFASHLRDLGAAALIVPEGDDTAARSAARQLGIRLLEFPQFTGARRPPPTASPSAATTIARPDDVALILHTSGTTSRPKQVPLSHRNLLASASAVASALRLRQDDTALNVMPLFHIHGIVGVLLASLRAGASVVCCRGFDADTFREHVSRGAVTWYSAVPTLHQAVLDACEGQPGLAGHQLRLIRSSSAALAPVVMQRLESCFGVPVIEAYGMTEAAHQMASNPLPPAVRKPGSVGRAAGPQIAIMDASGNRLATGERGEVVIRGDGVMSGYVDNPTANQTAFHGDWFRTGDEGYLDPEGYLVLTGRLKEMINRAGEKISPRDVDEALLGHPAVRQAITFAVPHPTIGEDVAAAVILHPGNQATEADLREWLFERLAPFRIPSRIIVVDEIPKGATGKIQRIGLHERFAAYLRPTHVAPVTETGMRLAGIWSDVLDVPEPGATDNFFAIGGDSLRATRVAARIRDAFGIDLEAGAIFRTPTIDALAMRIDSLRQRRDQELLDYVNSLSDEEVKRLLAERE